MGGSLCPVLRGALLAAGEGAQEALTVFVVRAGREGCVLADGTVELELEG